MRRLCWTLLLVCAAGSCVCAVGSHALGAQDTYLSDAIRDPAYSSALQTLLKHSGRLPKWTRQVLRTSGDYVGAPATYQTVGSVKYALFHTCEAHDCADNQLEVMFAPKGARAWGALARSGRSMTYLGAPDPAQQSALKAALQHP